MPRLKIAICVPAGDRVHTKWMKSVVDMQAHFLRSRLTNEAGEEYEKETRLFVVSSSMLVESRHRLCAEAVMWGADYLLWLDSDHVFPDDVLCRLWARNLDIVGVNYGRRCEPTAPTAAAAGKLVYTSKDQADARDVQEVDHLGMGMVLMKARVFDELQAKAEADGKASFMPLFLFELKEGGMSLIGEDVYFFKKCREAGLKVHLDHAVSWEIGHLHEMIVSNALTNVQRDDWEAEQKAQAQRLEDAAADAERSAA